MKSILFNIWGYPVFSYPFFILLSYLVGGFIFINMARKDRRNWSETLDVLLIGTISSVLGAKLFHVLFEAKGHILSNGEIALGIVDLLKDDPWHFARFLDPGYVFYGGLLISAGLVWIYLKKKSVYWPLAYGDYAAFALTVGIFLGRIGCFLGGCCFGKSTLHVPWAVMYPEKPLQDLGFVHPTQLYDAFYGLWALWLLKHIYARRRFAGETFGWFCVSYSFWRFITEFYRGDIERGFIFSSLSTSQAISLALGIIFFLYLRSRSARSSLDNWREV